MTDRASTTEPDILAAGAAADGEQAWDYVAAYTGNAWPEYERAYQRIRHRGVPFSWSFTLFFFPWIWLVYRRMPLLGIAVWAIETWGYLVSPLWTVWLMLLVRIVIAAFGRAIFLRKAMRQAVRARSTTPDRAAALAVLKDGGIATGAALFGTLIPLVVVTALFAGHNPAIKLVIH